MKKFLPALILATLSAQASYDQAPPSFAYREGKAVFIDFKTADYEIVYDLKNKSAFVESVIRFENAEAGLPLFDLVPEPLAATLDGKVVTTKAINDPHQQTTLRIVEKSISKGSHELRIRHQLTNNVVFKDEGVGSGLWMSDLNDRRYLEQYLPSNLEYDQYRMKAKVKIINAEGIPHVLKTNGKLNEINENEFEVTYPNFYTASSIYFHLLPKASLPNNVQFYYRSIDGRHLPVDIYTSYNMDDFVSSTKKILTELENDYGPFPHEQLIIYGNAPSGGMEYCGATATSLSALGHELFHSYHARGLTPANGNAGWMDEAIARFRDNKYPLISSLNFESTRLAGWSVYTRKTDRMAYTEGSAFLSWIGFRMNLKGLSLKGFLREYFEKYKYTTVTTELFERELTEFAEMDLAPDFRKYIYGKTITLKSNVKPQIEEDPHHPSFTQSELELLSFPK